MGRRCKIKIDLEAILEEQEEIMEGQEDSRLVNSLDRITSTQEAIMQLLTKIYHIHLGNYN